MEFNERYHKLNDAQKKAVDTIDGPVMVVAGPGTGKTELLSVRAANILQKTDTLPENILCLTFTESGAAAMRERLVGIIGRDAYKIAVHTFHSFGSEIISNNRDYFYRGAKFQPADELATYEILRAIFATLDYNNPLASVMNDEFTYLRDTQRIISQLKSSGLTSDELRTVLNTNDLTIDVVEQLLAPIFVERSSKQTVAKLEAQLDKIRAIDDQQILPEIPRLSVMLADNLALAIDQFHEINKTSPITAWRESWFKKDNSGKYILKARAQQLKLRAVDQIYYEYISHMEQAGLYDFDDMILQVVHALSVNDDLRFNLQEKYLYIMVDEFQDTNLAQMRIVRSLTDNPASEGKPNIMVVGDDDQAIYSFQGALVSNILDFEHEFPSLKRIVLTDNYRSAAEILKSARSVIRLGQDRLEDRIDGLSKELTAKKPGAGQVQLHEATTALDERHWLVESIAADIKKGTKPSDIAVFTRHHRDIASLLPFFAHAKINVHYERRDNVLGLEPIVQLEYLARVVIAMANSQLELADSLLPELLAHPAWGFSASDIWKLSVNAHDNHARWLDTMAITPKFVDLQEWLTEMAMRSRYTPLEAMLDLLIGRPNEAVEALSFTSSFYNYFFSSTALDQDPESYLLFLNGLRSLRNKLSDYKAGEGLKLEGLTEFIDLHRRLGSTIRVNGVGDERVDNAVNLMTAHASKGLEFDTVYVVGAIDKTWGEKARPGQRLISYPENLQQLAPAGETTDERLRLFYVALTRAKKSLHISYSLHDDKDKGCLRVSFLAGDGWAVKPITAPKTIAAATEMLATAWYEPLVTPTTELNQLLAPILHNYKLSATHLNAFVDVVKGGPQAFLLNHLLRFPQAPSPQLSYGRAIHQTLQQAHLHLTKTGEKRPLEDILGDLETNLQAQRLSALDYETYLQQGSDELRTYLNARYDSFTPEQKTELNFAGQNSVVGDAILTGSLDLVLINDVDKTIDITDYKTGKPSYSWAGKKDYEKIKLHKYRQQLMFYKLLVEHARDYGRYTVATGSLDFIQPTKDGDVITLTTDFSHDELERTEKLIAAVWKHIKNLQLPDVAAYEHDYKGVLAFEQDLIDDKI